KEAAGYIGEELKELEIALEGANKLEERGQSRHAVILTVKFADVVTQSWPETKEWLEDTIISALVGSMRDREIREQISIHPGELYRIKTRCKKKNLISADQLNRRRGREKTN